MQGDVIPDDNHVARYCKPQAINESGQPTGTAFRLREKEKYLSVNWLESLRRPQPSDAIDALRDVFNRKFSLSKRSLIAVLDVGKTKKYIFEESTDSRALKFVHKPGFNDESHSGIYGYSYEDNLIAELMADTVSETHKPIVD